MTTHRAKYEGATPNKNYDVYPTSLCGELEVNDRITKDTGGFFTVDCAECLRLEAEAYNNMGRALAKALGPVISSTHKMHMVEDAEARAQVEKELHEAGIIEDPDMDGGLLG